MVSWKDSFEKINTELELNKRKKQALDDLQQAGRISQFAYECLNKELSDEIQSIEAKRKALTEKMTRKLNELEEQRIALEMFLATTEMAHAAGEIDDELHGKESVALGLGLEATKQELNWIKDIILQLAPREIESLTGTQITAIAADTVETASEDIIEKKTENVANVTVEMPIETTATATEVAVEQIPPQSEIPPSAPPATNEGGQPPGS